jgi:hypothetical protein
LWTSAWRLSGHSCIQASSVLELMLCFRTFLVSPARLGGLGSGLYSRKEVETARYSISVLRKVQELMVNQQSFLREDQHV